MGIKFSTEISKATTYRTIEANISAEFKDRGSKFIAYAYPINLVELVKEKVKALKEEHSKAVHFCYAFRIGTDGNLFRASDDGEPSGSAGKPILGQIDSAELTNILIVVVRYFGGTLLGVPGLINAYKTAASSALQVSTVIEKNVERQYRLEFPYPLMNEVMRILKQNEVNIIQQDMKLFCEYLVGIPLLALEATLEKLGKLRDLKYKEVN